MISHCQFLKDMSGVFLGSFEGNVTFQLGNLVVGDHLFDDLRLALEGGFTLKDQGPDIYKKGELSPARPGC
jgi:hypothetical protein